MMRIMPLARLALTLLLAAVSTAGAQSPVPGRNDESPSAGRRGDNLSDPLAQRRVALKKRGVEAKLNGKAPGRIYRAGKGQFVELDRQGEDSIFTIVAQFGTQDSPFAILRSGIPGPLRNAIPQPDRTIDNTTIWAPDFSKGYYETLLFSPAAGAVSMRNFYIEQSSGRYTVNGDVTDWVTVPYNAAHYGRNYCGGIVCQQTWRFVQDAANAWYAAEIASGKTVSEVNAYLAKFDTWDRYDQDGDGNFSESDGYIDHFQIVHAGEGEETGGGAQGADAIWSHRWAVQYAGGPTLDDGTVVPYGGTRIGLSKYWIRDYTVEPENGGVGVFAHEFGHDLGLPDLYDTSGNTGGAENSTGFWTLYSSGSYGSTGRPEEGIGSKPVPMSAFEKIFLGWSNYEIVAPGQQKSVKLGPAMANTKQAQQLVVLLPAKQVVALLYPPYAGDYFYTSGSGNDLDRAMTRQVTLPAGTVTLAAKVRYDIESDWDYAYLTINGQGVPTNRSTNTNPNGNNLGNGITGDSSAAWVDLTANLTAYAGQTVTIGFRYSTDEAVAGTGFSVDDIAITGFPVDGAEADAGWTLGGFTRASAAGVTQSFFNAYFAEYRTYRGYDEVLRTGPYNFGFPATPNRVEHFPYQDGLLVWYYDESFADNNVGDYCAVGRCGGLVLPVDAHPDLLIRPDNSRVWRPRFQSYDSTFGLKATDPVCLHANGIKQCYGGLPANPVFDDSQSYWVAPDPAIGHLGWASVPVPQTGTRIRVTSISTQGNFMQVLVNKR